MASEYSQAAEEGRDFLGLILEDEAAGIDLDEKEDWEIEVWLEELGYEWNGASWVKSKSGEQHENHQTAQ